MRKQQRYFTYGCILSAIIPVAIGCGGNNNKEISSNQSDIASSEVSRMQNGKGNANGNGPSNGNMQGNSAQGHGPSNGNMHGNSANGMQAGKSGKERRKEQLTELNNLGKLIVTASSDKAKNNPHFEGNQLEGEGNPLYLAKGYLGVLDKKAYPALAKALVPKFTDKNASKAVKELEKIADSDFKKVQSVKKTEQELNTLKAEVESFSKSLEDSNSPYGKVMAELNDASEKIKSAIDRHLEAKQKAEQDNSVDIIDPVYNPADETEDNNFGFEVPAEDSNNFAEEFPEENGGSVDDFVDPNADFDNEAEGFGDSFDSTELSAPENSNPLFVNTEVNSTSTFDVSDNPFGDEEFSPVA